MVLKEFKAVFVDIMFVVPIIVGDNCCTRTSDNCCTALDGSLVEEKIGNMYKTFHYLTFTS